MGELLLCASSFMYWKILLQCITSPLVKLPAHSHDVFIKAVSGLIITFILVENVAQTAACVKEIGNISQFKKNVWCLWKKTEHPKDSTGI